MTQEPCLGAADLAKVAGGHTEQAPHRGPGGKLGLQLPYPSVHHSELSPGLAAGDFSNMKKLAVLYVLRNQVSKEGVLSQLAQCVKVALKRSTYLSKSSDPAGLQIRIN